MSIKIRSTSGLHLLVTAFVLFGASISSFVVASSLGQPGFEIAGVGVVSQSTLSVAAAMLCAAGSVYLAVGSVRLDRRIRAGKGVVALAQD